MNWSRHNLYSHILCASSEKYGILMLHFACERCGDKTDRRCNGVAGWPLYRLNAYALEHRHGMAPFPNPVPR